MTKVCEWYEPETNEWYLIFKCDEENYKKWEKENQIN